jgi:Zn-dependent protease
MPGFNPELFLIGMIVIILSIALHEFGHAISADFLGDPGPRRAGRITLWPPAHFDLFGFIMIVFTQISGFGLGWGKPVMVDSRYFRHPRRDMLIVAAFGPLMNLLQAIVAGMILRVILATGHQGMLVQLTNPDDILTFGRPTVTALFLQDFLFINLSLMFFNLLPIHPLDGGKILSALLPNNQAAQFDRFMWQWGPMILIMLILTGSRLLGPVLIPAISSMATIIVGPGVSF